ncbi:MAG TPA: YaaR family protein [Symbiobacteriaceae bacterium]|jgi:hypothetical protein
MDRVRFGSEVAPNLPVRGRSERPAGPAAAAFKNQLSTAHAGQFNERIEKGLAEIERLGDRLADSQTFGDLKQYKQAVAVLVRDLTNHMVQIRTDLDWDTQTWEQRTLVTIRRVDEELEKLTNLVLDQEKDHLAILDKIGEIRGLLLDMKM